MKREKLIECTRDTEIYDLKEGQVFTHIKTYWHSGEFFTTAKCKDGCIVDVPAIFFQDFEKVFVVDGWEEKTFKEIKAKGSGFNKWHKSEIDNMPVGEVITFPMDNDNSFTVERIK